VCPFRKFSHSKSQFKELKCLNSLAKFGRQQISVNYALVAKFFECKHSMLEGNLARGRIVLIATWLWIKLTTFWACPWRASKPQNFPAQSKYPNSKEARSGEI